MALGRQLQRFRQDRRQFGVRYALAALLAMLNDRLVVRPVDNCLLNIEGERGVLGPVHRRYRGHSAYENRELWERYDWRDDAEDWTPSPEWKAWVVDHLLRPTMSPGGVILEIGPGGGRWSKHLREWADELLLVDVTERALALCRERLGANGHIGFIQSHGSDLPGVDDESVDRVWSFDVFVHIAPVDVAGYLAEIARVLRPGGVAMIHHSGVSRARGHERGWRSPMTGKLFANLARERGLTVVRQLEDWPERRADLGDVVTELAR
jgi:ubiquinone/menaquinone biosynthesis C-methylase UbiE